MSVDQARSESQPPGPEHPGLLPATLGATADIGLGRVNRSARDWLVDTLCVVLAAVMGAVPLLLSGPDDTTSPTATLNLVVGAVACAAVWLRRRWPVALALVLIVLSVWFVPVSGASSIALFTVAVHRKTATVVPLTVLCLLTPLLQFKLYPLEPNTPTVYWMAVGAAGMLSVLAVAWGMAVRARRQLVVSLAERARRAETEQELRVGQARLRERERIAREMHDVLAHRLSLLSMHAGALEFRPDAPAEEIGNAAGVIRASAHQSLVDLQEVIHMLRDSAPEEERQRLTMADLQALVEETRDVGTEVEFDDQATDLEDVPAILGRNTYRIVQEGLTNARKHAPDSVVHLSVRGTPGDGVTIEIRNALQAPGTRSAGAPVLPGSGAGLAGIGERAALAGGRLEQGRTMGGEFRLWAWLPWPT